MIFKHEVYIGSSELSPISDPTRALKAIVFKQDCTVGGFQGGLRGRNSTGGTCAEEGGRDACFKGATCTNVSTHTDGGQEHSTGAPGNLASACPRRPPLVMYHLLLGSLISWTWETGSWGYWDFRKCLFCSLVGGM
jgi:hypothetical protein